MRKRTKAQQRALLQLWQRYDKAMSFLQFRRQSVYSETMGCVLVGQAGMVFGIEDDGYTHT